MATRTLNVILSGDPAGLQRTFATATKSATAAKVGIAGAVLAAGALAKTLYDVGGEFDDAFDTIRIGTGATGKQLDGLKADFKGVISNVPADFDEAAEAISELNRRLGITGKPLRARARQFLELSRITGSDLPEDIRNVTRAFGDWEIAVGKQGKALDFLFRASQASGASVAELTENVVKFGAPLRQVGFTFNEAVAMFASFEKAGVNVTTMMPGLKQAMKTFFEANKDPKQGIIETFKGIEDGSIKASEALKIFGTRAGGDMIEAVEQGRFHLDRFTSQLATGKDTILGVGEETKDASERFKEFANRMKVLVEPAATAVFNAVGQFTEELTKLDFKSPISGAVAFGLAFGAVTVAVLAAQRALVATWATVAANPFSALILGAGLAVSALLVLGHSEEKNVHVYQRAKRALNNLAASTHAINQTRRDQKKAAQQVRAAEQHLTDVRRKFGPNSQQAIEAEAHLARVRQRLRDLNQKLRNQERKHGVERHAAAILIRGDSQALARQSERLREKQEEEVIQLKHLITNRKSLAKAGLDTKHITELIRKKQDELGGTTDKLNGKNRQLSEILIRAGREIGPKYASKLQTLIERTQKATRRTSDLGRWLDKLPPKKKIDVEVKIKVGGLNVGGGGQGGREGQTGDGWGLGPAINKGIERKVKRKVQDYADENPMAVLMASAGGGGSLGPHVPGAWQAFIPIAERFGLHLTSGYRPGSITSSGNASYHSMNRAGDFADGAASMLTFARFMAQAFGPVLRELIHTPLGFSIKDGRVVAPYAAAEHYDHVHVAYQQGGVVPGRGDGDKVPISFMAEPGERLFVLNRNASDALGALSTLNGTIPRFQKGGVVSGRVSWFNGPSPTTASGTPVAKPGLALNLHPGTDAGWDNPTTRGWMDAARAGNPVYGRTMIAGHSANLPIIDLGPDGETGRAIDVTEAGVRKLGFTPDNFPTDAIGKVRILGGGGAGGKGKKSRGGRAHVDKKTGGMQAPKAAAKGPNPPIKRLPIGPGSVPKSLQGLGGGITSLFATPGMTQQQKLEAADVALSIAETTSSTEDDRAVLKYQLGANQARKAKAQKEIARLNKRLKTERLTDKQRRQIEAKIARERAALGESQGAITAARQGIEGLEGEGEGEGEETEAQRAAREATERLTEALQEHKAAEEELAKEMKTNRQIAESSLGTSSAVAMRALADIISGQLGPRAYRRSQTAGSGSVGTY